MLDESFIDDLRQKFVKKKPLLERIIYDCEKYKIFNIHLIINENQKDIIEYLSKKKIKANIKIHIEKLVTYLMNKEMIQEDLQLSQKGKIVAEINECNSLVMAKIIENGLFEWMQF